MTFLTPHLPFSSASPLPPPGAHLVISDTLNSPGYFALYHLLAAALGNKEERRKVVWVDLRGEGRGSLETVMKKIGTPLPPATSAQFVQIAPSSLPHVIPVPPKTPRLFDKDGNPSLKDVYDAIVPQLAEGVLLVLDGVGTLVEMGMGVEEVVRLVRAVYAQVCKLKAILTTTLHADSLPLPSPAPYAPGPDARLLEGLTRIGTGCWWRTSHLASGRSGDVMGEISSHPFGDYKAEEYVDVARSKPLQYRLETATVKVFAKGTGRGFL
ncbi:hypothetical protein IAR50_006971 [Cryptococcus sp. DSM 104548]